jgi:hypothetical protein
LSWQLAVGIFFNGIFANRHLNLVVFLVLGERNSAALIFGAADSFSPGNKKANAG